MSFTINIPEFDMQTLQAIAASFSYFVGVFYTRKLAKWTRGDVLCTDNIVFEQRLMITVYYLLSPLTVPITTIVYAIYALVYAVSTLFLGVDK